MGGGYPLENNGFTLIELLAVIVILAILALIAIPRIADIIDNSEESATLAGGRNYLRAVEQAILNKNLKEKFNPSECEIQSDGNLVCDGKLLEIEMTGNRPSEGTITIEKKVPVAVDGMLLDGYVLNMPENGNLEMFGRIEDITPQGTYLTKASSTSGANVKFLGQDKINKSQVESVTIKNRKKVPSNAIYSWDVSAAKDNSVIAWYTDIDNNGLYELYIGGDGGVKANPDSSNLFNDFSNVTTIDLNYMNTEDVTNMTNMFNNCENLTKLNLINLVTVEVTNMNSMFNYCKNLTVLDLSNFDTSKVTNMANMFTHCWKLETITGLEKFNTSNVTNMNSMFYNCYRITMYDLRNMTFTNVTSYIRLFYEARALTNIIVKDTDAKTFIEARLADVSKTGVTVTIAS